MRWNQQQRVQDFAVAIAFHTQCKRKALVRDKRERMRRIQRHGCQHREDLAHEDIVQSFPIGSGQFIPADDMDTLARHQATQTDPDILLCCLQSAALFVDQLKLLCGCAPIQ